MSEVFICGFCSTEYTTVGGAVICFKQHVKGKGTVGVTKILQVPQEGVTYNLVSIVQ